MHLSITTNSITKSAFCGQHKKTEKNNPYYKTNSGMEVGGAIAAATLLSAVFNDKILDATQSLNEWYYKNAEKLGIAKSEESLKEVEKIFKRITKIVEKNKKIPKSVIAIAAIGTAAVHCACGYIADYYRNNKAKQTADVIAKEGMENVFLKNDEMRLSSKNKPYRHAENGTEIGIASGIAGGTIIYFLNALKRVQGTKGPNFFVSIVLSAIAGWLFTNYSDSLANKDSVKNA